MIIDPNMIMQPAEIALTNMDEALDKTADAVGQAGYLPVGVRNGLMAFVAAGKANVDGARQIKHEIADCAKASIDANISAAEAAMKATSLGNAMTVQRDHLTSIMKDNMSKGSQFAELALAISKKAAAALSKRPEGP